MVTLTADQYIRLEIFKALAANKMETGMIMLAINNLAPIINVQSASGTETNSVINVQIS